MGAFQSGFESGQRGYQQALDNKDRAAIRERQKVEQEQRDTLFAQDQEQRTRALGIQTKNDALMKQLTEPNAGNYALAPAATETGLRMLKAGTSSGQGMQIDMSAPGADAPSAPATGLRRPSAEALMPAGGYTTNQAPTGAAAQKILSQIALNKEDIAGYNSSQQQAKQMGVSEAYSGALARFHQMSEAEKAAEIQKHSDNLGIRGNGTWVTGTGKKAGYMQYMPPGKDVIKLTSEEAAQVFALSAANDIDPLWTRAQLNSVSENVRKVANELSQAEAKAAGEHNEGTYRRDYVDAIRERAAGAAAGGKGVRQTMGSPVQMYDPVTGQTALMVPTLVDGVMKMERMDTGGMQFMKPPQQMTPQQGKAYEMVLQKLMDNPDMPQGQVDALWARSGVSEFAPTAGGGLGGWGDEVPPPAPTKTAIEPTAVGEGVRYDVGGRAADQLSRVGNGISQGVSSTATALRGLRPMNQIMNPGSGR
jgi:hypothetical protein